MIGLLKDPGAAASLQAAVVMHYLANDNATAHRLARRCAVASSHSDTAGELLAKAAFRLRKAGMLAVERDRLDALRDHHTAVYAADPEQDRRIRVLRGRLDRLATLEDMLAHPVPRRGPELDAALRLLCGPHGWYHNMPLPDGRGSFDVGHIKLNSPVGAPDHNAFQLDLLRPHLPAFEGRTVADIGPADGYFGLTAAREGARVLMIEPDPLHCQRIRFFGKLYGVEDRVQLANTFLTERHTAMLGSLDICIASGLLYHLWPLRGSLDLLLNTAGLLVLEYEFTDRDLNAPDEAESGWQPSTPIPDRWLRRHLDEQGWAVREFPQWEAKLARDKPGGTPRRMILCRRVADRG